MYARSTFKSFLFATVAIPVVLSAGAAIAQSTDSGGMETVVVTAERRAEPLFDVPATITAISGEKLQNLGITDMKSIVEMVPNAVLPDDPENFETYINIRGVHQADINAEPNFGLYRNGIFAGGERANLGAQIDIDNVDILSGPQSGLYGRDAVGGVVNVNYKTASTSDPLGGYAIASYGNWQRSELQGAVNIPLTDNFAVRATGWWINQNQGQIYNPTLGDYIDANRDIGGRVSAKWEANNRLSFLWMAELEDRHGPSFDAYAPNGIGAVFNVRCCGLPVQGPETLKTVYEDTANTEHWQQFYLSQDVNYDTNSWAGTFELLGAYRNYHLHLQEDQDHTAFGPTYSPMVLQQIQYRFEGMHNFYGELLWKSPDNQPLTWMAGVDYFNETFTFQRIFDGSVDFNLLNTPAFGPGFTYGNLLCSFLMAGNDPPGSYDGGCEGTPGVAPGLPGAGLNGQFPYNFPNIGVQSGANAFGGPGSGIDTKSISGFGTVTYKFTDALSVTGELRWDQTQKHLNYSQGPVAGYGATALGASYLDPLFAQIFDPYTDVQTDTYVNLAPSVNIQYKLSDTANLYATYATGFRSGGFNLGTSSADHLSYKPETDSNYEIGAKTMWLDGRLGVNADVFYMPQHNLVEPEYDPSEPAILDEYFLGNVGNSRTYGAELQADYRALDWLTLGTSVGWLDDKFTGGISEGYSLNGQEVPLTRDWTVNFTYGIAYPISETTTFVSDADWRLEYGGYLPAALPAGHYVLETTPYGNLSNLDLDAGISFGQTRVVGYIDNAFNDIVWQFQYSDGVVNVNQGRTFGIRVETKF